MVNLILQETSPRISSQSELELLVSNEKNRYNCNKIITAKLYGFNGVQAQLWIDGRYHIKMGREVASRLGVIHEVYHICDGHAEIFVWDDGLNHLHMFFMLS